ncbi:unnamed protein product [Paramecium sonneborni]|uniref:Uncharacterized protein n=1 Tax=Paramecium sonneborni TaxID=65129 RepID=A0A8S1R3C7_9CILI|nr:unnamed protein product [Paramecium sonneborni]
MIPMLKNQRRLLTSIQSQRKKEMTKQNEQNMIQKESLDILGNGKLYLLCIYNEPNKDPITNIVFINVEVRESQIQFKFKYSLCPIMKQADVMKQIQMTDWVQIKDQERFDMSPYLPEQNIQKQIIFQQYLKDYDPHHDLQDIVQFLTFSKKQLQIIRCNNYNLKIINRKSPLEQTYTPEILDLHPFCLKNHKSRNIIKIYLMTIIPQVITVFQKAFRFYRRLKINLLIKILFLIIHQCNLHTKIFVDIQTINISYQNNSQLTINKKQSFFPYLTPYYYIRDKQTAIQTQAYRIWL